MRKIKFPSLELDDIIVGYESIHITKLIERYEPFYDYNFFEDEFYNRTKCFVDYSNFDDMGFLTMSIMCSCDDYNSTDFKQYLQKTYLEIYNEYKKERHL